MNTSSVQSSEQSQTQNELTSIFTRMKTDKTHQSIKALCAFITKNRSNTDETIKKISLFKIGRASCRERV